MHVIETKDVNEYQKISPDFIFNRFDLMNENFIALKIINRNSEKVIQARIIDDKAELGVWLTKLTWTEMGHILYWFYTKHPEIKTVCYKNGTVPMGQIKSHNHFRIELPETKEEMMQRVSGPSRKKLRKKMRLAQETFGKLTVYEYERSQIPEEAVRAFFHFKYLTRNRLYIMSWNEYLDTYHISHAYVFKLGNEIAAVRFACEQCSVVYGENFAYNPKFADYSMGVCIFFYHLIRLVEKKHSQLFFAGGNFEYKTHYGSIEEKLFDCEIILKEFDFSKFQNLPQKEPAEPVPADSHCKPSKKGFLNGQFSRFLSKFNKYPPA